MPDDRRQGKRFYCPGCDKIIGVEPFGPISGAWWCDGCVAAGKDKPKTKAKKKKDSA